MRGYGNKRIAEVLLALALSFSDITQGANSPEDIFWNSVRKSDVVEEYRLYVEQYPRGKYSGEAWRSIGRLEAEAEAKRIAAELKRIEVDAALGAETENWKRAESAKDSATVQSYLDRYPNGRYVVEARRKLAAEMKEELNRGYRLGSAGDSCTANFECGGQLKCNGGVCVRRTY